MFGYYEDAFDFRQSCIITVYSVYILGFMLFGVMVLVKIVYVVRYFVDTVDIASVSDGIFVHCMYCFVIKLA